MTLFAASLLPAAVVVDAPLHSLIGAFRIRVRPIGSSGIYSKCLVVLKA
jgi:hypothetical protein